MKRYVRRRRRFLFILGDSGPPPVPGDESLDFSVEANSQYFVVLF